MTDKGWGRKDYVDNTCLSGERRGDAASLDSYPSDEDHEVVTLAPALGRDSVAAEGGQSVAQYCYPSNWSELNRSQKKTWEYKQRKRGKSGGSHRNDDDYGLSQVKRQRVDSISGGEPPSRMDDNANGECLHLSDAPPARRIRIPHDFR